MKPVGMSENTASALVHPLAPFRLWPVRLAASVLTGILLVVIFPGWSLTFLVWVACLPVLLALLHETSLRRAFLLGYIAGVLYWAGGCSWFISVMERYGDLNPPLAVGAFVLFLTVYSTFYGLWGLALGVAGRQSALLSVVAAPFFWVTLEVGRAHLMYKFPWDFLGYAVSPTGIRQIAVCTSVYGLSLLAVATSALLAWTAVRYRSPRAWAPVGVWILLVAGANFLLTPPKPQAGTEQAFLLQPDVPLDDANAEKWVPWRDPSHLNDLISLSERSAASQPAGPDPPLIIWAENPAPFYFSRDPVFTSGMRELARRTGAYTIFNTVTFAGENNTLPHNSAIVLGPDGSEILQYDKIQLVPFGEYVPWPFNGLTGKITSQVGDFVPGSTWHGAATPKGTLTVLICYEAVFPDLVRRLTSDGPGVLINISNDAWYGTSAAAYQDLEMARFRAIEERRFLLRATNDGITSVIDPYGRILAKAPRYQRLVMPVKFKERSGATFYHRYGDLFAFVCTVIAAILLALTGLMARKRQTES
jgi:apolipoprotein N-acyltransferase